MFKCNDCGEEFDEECDLGIHLTSDFGEELDDDRCKCTLCGEEFDDWGDLQMHIMWSEKKGCMTGETLKKYNKAINSPEFKELRAEIDKHYTNL